MSSESRITSYDPELAAILDNRAKENTDGFTLIPSENHPHPEDLAAKRAAEDATFEGGYFEGYPPPEGVALGLERYYQGCENADRLEALARQRIIAVLAQSSSEARVNVQTPTGALANVCAYLGVLTLGDTIVSPSLQDGYGHLSHGADSPNIVSKLFKVHGYGIDPKTGLIDYDALEELVKKVHPKLVLAGFSSYPRDVDWARIVRIANEAGAISMADIAHPAGLIAASLLQNPFAHGVDIVTSTTHKTLGGVKGAFILYNAASLARKVPDRVAQMGRWEGEFRGIEQAVFPGLMGGPHMPTIAAHVSTFRRALTPVFRELQERTRLNAVVLAKELVKLGWPVMTGGTDNHLVLISDVSQIDGLQGEASRRQGDPNKDGWVAAQILEGVGIVTNKNGVPGVPGSPVRPKGLRVGTPAISTRGMGEDQVRKIAKLMDQTLRNARDAVKIGEIRSQVRDLARAFPVRLLE